MKTVTNSKRPLVDKQPTIKHMDFKGEDLKEWTLEKEDETSFFLKDSEGKSMSYLKSTFDHEIEFDGASRIGDRFYIPQKKSK